MGTFGTETFRADGPNAEITTKDDFAIIDEFSGFIFGADSDSGTFSGVQLEFLFFNSAGTAFSSDALPTSLTLADFQSGGEEASFSAIGRDFGSVDATFSSVSIAPVAAIPLPASIPLLLAGLGTLAMVRRKAA